MKARNIANFYKFLICCYVIVGYYDDFVPLRARISVQDIQLQMKEHRRVLYDYLFTFILRK